VTDPKLPPELISEISNPGFNLGTVVPALVRTSVDLEAGDTPAIEYALVIGSGPIDLRTATISGASTIPESSSLTPQLFVYELTADGATLDANGSIDTNPDDTFIGGITAADWDGDDIDDAIYFGTVGGTNAEPSGQLYRGELGNNNAVSTQQLIDAQGAIEQPPFIPTNQLLVEDKYILFGTGRFFVPEDLLVQFDEPNVFAGIIEDFEVVDSEITFGSTTIADNLSASNILPTEVDDNTNSSIVDDVITVGSEEFNRGQLLVEFGSDSTYQGWVFEIPPFVEDGIHTSRMSAAPFTLEELVFFADFEPQLLEDARIAGEDPSICLPGGSGFINVFDYRIGIVPAAERFTLSDEVLLPTDQQSDTDAPIRRPVSNSLVGGTAALLLGEDADGNLGIRLKIADGDGGFPELAGTLLGPPDDFGRRAWREISIPE